MSRLKKIKVEIVLRSTLNPGEIPEYIKSKLAIGSLSRLDIISCFAIHYKKTYVLPAKGGFRGYKNKKV